MSLNIPITLPDDDVNGGPVPTTYNITNTLFLPLIAFVTLLGNAAVMIAFYKVPVLRRKPSNLLILNLAVSDFVNGWIILAVLSVYAILERNPYGEVGCAVAVCLNEYISLVSLTTLCLISIDRVLLVSQDYRKYMKIQSRTRIKTTIALCWVFWMILIVLELSLWQFAKKISVRARYINFEKSCIAPTKTIKAFSLFIILTFNFPLGLITVLSLVFVYSLRKRLQMNGRVGGLNGANPVAGPNGPVADPVAGFSPRAAVNQVHTGVGEIVTHNANDELPPNVPTASSSRGITNKVRSPIMPMPNVETKTRSISEIADITTNRASTSNDVIVGSHGINVAESAAINDIPTTSSRVAWSHNRNTSSHWSSSTNTTHIEGSILTERSDMPTTTNPTTTANRGVTPTSIIRDDVNKNRYIKPAVTFAVLVIALGVCVTPYAVYITVLSFCPKCVPGIDSPVRKSLLILYYFNSTINPFLYAMTQRQIIHYYRTTLRDFFIYNRR